MGLVVQKFGGSSVANAERVFNVARTITDTYKQGNDVVVVVSAQGDTTDDLIEKAKEILETGEYRVCEVGEMVGIEDPAYFTHVFLKYEGKSPPDFMNR